MANILKALFIILVFLPFSSFAEDSQDITDPNSSSVDENVQTCNPQCDELKVGECRKPVACSSKETLANKSAFFKICKTGKNELTAHLNITFFKDNDPSSWDPDKITREAGRKGSAGEKMDRKWRNKVHSCFKRYKNRLGDGKRRIGVRVHPATSKKGSSNIMIEVENPKFRSYDTVWTRYIDCPTIIHEIGHHLGLCDEYKIHKKGDPLVGEPPPQKFSNASASPWNYQRVAGFIKNWFKSFNKKKHPARSCRALGNKYSAMRDPAAALSGMRKMKYQMCKCQNIQWKNLSKCKLKLETYKALYASREPDDIDKAASPQSRKQKNKGCPKGFRPWGNERNFRGTTRDFRDMLNKKHVDGNKGIYNWDLQGFPYFAIVTDSGAPKSGGAFQPKHLDSMEYPNCANTEARKKYYNCARGAYKKGTNCPRCGKNGEWSK